MAKITFEESDVKHTYNNIDLNLYEKTLKKFIKEHELIEKELEDIDNDGFT